MHATSKVDTHNTTTVAKKKKKKKGSVNIKHKQLQVLEELKKLNFLYIGICICTEWKSIIV
jgi:hypothetical protein